MARPSKPPTVVVSFRLPEDKFKALEEEFARAEVSAVGTPQLLARKFVIDVLAGWLTYKNPKHRTLNHELVERSKAEAKAPASRKRE